MKILIAEDDTSLRRVLVSILQKNNYSVDAVDNGSDALDYLCSDLYDAAVLDIMMRAWMAFPFLPVFERKVIRHRSCF